MFVPLPASRAVTVYRRGGPTGRDRLGVDTHDPVGVQVRDCVWFPAGSRGTPSSTDSGDVTVTRRMDLVLPSGTAIAAEDRVELPDWPGVQWRVEGDVTQYRSVWTGVDGRIVARLERVTG